MTQTYNLKEYLWSTTEKALSFSSKFKCEELKDLQVRWPNEVFRTLTYHPERGLFSSRDGVPKQIVSFDIILHGIQVPEDNSLNKKFIPVNWINNDLKVVVIIFTTYWTFLSIKHFTYFLI